MASKSSEAEPGVPQWTEIDQDSGLDPLGMQRPIEVLFQSLLPGVSTITLRLRYYSLFAWLLEAYAKSKGDTDPSHFNLFHRKAEALFALVCARRGSELGVTGIDWAGKHLGKAQAASGPGQTIEFAKAADPNSPQEVRYLRNKGGAFGAIYSTQMAEMGLVHLFDEEVGIPYCTTAALALAQAFEEAIGTQAGRFLDAIDRGNVSIAELDELANVLPSNITSGSTEQSRLVDALLGRLKTPSPSDIARRETFRLVLAQASQREGRPLTDDLKWAFFELANEPGEGLSGEVCEAWALYQACDLARLAYECLLEAALIAVRVAPGSRLPLQATVEIVAAQAAPPKGRFEDFLANAATDQSAKMLTGEMLDARKRGSTAEMVSAAIFLIASLYRRWGEFSPRALEWLNVGDYFQSLHSEARYYETLLSHTAGEAIERIVTERIVKRHLWVASRKLRNKAYTFLLEPDEGVLRYREGFRVTPSSPRLDQAIQFLVDSKLLGEDGPTHLGELELAGK